LESEEIYLAGVIQHAHKIETPLYLSIFAVALPFTPVNSIME